MQGNLCCIFSAKLDFSLVGGVVNCSAPDADVLVLAESVLFFVRNMDRFGDVRSRIEKRLEMRMIDLLN